MRAAINAGGQVVGSSISSCTAEEPTFRAFLWEDGSIFDLNTLMPSGSALYLQVTETINDRGEIAGTGADASGNEHAFLLIPCDENHPDVEGCDYSLVDAAAATRVSPTPVIEGQPNAKQSGSVPQLLRRQRSPLGHIRGITLEERANTAVSDSTDQQGSSCCSGTSVADDLLKDVPPRSPTAQSHGACFRASHACSSHVEGCRSIGGGCPFRSPQHLLGPQVSKMLYQMRAVSPAASTHRAAGFVR